MTYHFQRLFLLTIYLASYSYANGQEKTPEINVVYGDKHIFTIQTPIGWTNDKEFAKKIGLVNFFYSSVDTLVKQKSYMYANGYDKNPSGQSLQNFIDNDLKKYKMKYPEFKFERIEVGLSGGIKNGQLYSFSNLHDRYREEILFTESNEAIIVFSFSATTESDYKKYQSVFDSFVSSFVYRGNNPKPFLEYMSKKKN